MRMDTDNFIIPLKTECVYDNIENDVEKNTSCIKEWNQ